MRWLIKAKVTAATFVTVEANTEREAVQKFRDEEWIEQSDFDVLRVAKLGRPELAPLPKHAKPKPRTSQFDVGQRVRFKDGRRGSITAILKSGGVMVHYDDEFGQAFANESELMEVNPAHESEPETA